MGATFRFREGRGWNVYVRHNGKQRAEKCASEAEAIATAEAINRKTKAKDTWLIGGPLPIARVLDGWIAARGPSMATSTEQNMKSVIRAHLAPYFPDMDLRQLSRDDLIAFIDAKFKDGLAPRTIDTALGALRRVCQLHVDEGIIETNVCLRSGKLVANIGRRYEHTGREIDAWTHEDAGKLLDVAREFESKLYAPVLFALHTGARRGEVLGLKWKDIGPKQIQIRRALVRGKLTTTKNGKERTVPISTDLRAVLDELAERRHIDEGPWSDPDFVFMSPQGKRWDERNFARAFDRLRRKAHETKKVRSLSFHCARHTFASWALEGGRSIVWVQHRLGHGSPEITLRVYSHFMPSPDDELDFLAPALKIVGVTKA